MYWQCIVYSTTDTLIVGQYYCHTLPLLRPLSRMYCQRTRRHTYYCTTGTLLYYRYANACRPCTGSAAVQYYRYANGSCTGSAVLLMNYVLYT